jgi:hypothetical protein
VVSERIAVARYFAEIDRLQVASGSDPNAVANQILKRAAAGDRGGFDDLFAEQRALRDRLAAIDVPLPCREHHRRSLEALDEAAALLGSVLGGIAQGQTADLTSTVARGQALEAKAREVDAVATEIKRRYGLLP